MSETVNKLLEVFKKEYFHTHVTPAWFKDKKEGKDNGNI